MIKLSNRLMAVASLVNSGALLGDIGCDHGYLPAYLIENGIIKGAVAADINEKPLKSCERLINEYNLSDKIKTRLSNGLENINDNECDTITIAGMGGELIADILKKCDYVAKKHLILQPMTHPEIVRKWLFDNSFKILNDFTVSEGVHHYIVLDAVFDCNKVPYTDTDLFLGRIKDYSDKEYFIHLCNYLTNKQKSGVSYDTVIDELKRRADL